MHALTRRHAIGTVLGAGLAACPFCAAHAKRLGARACSLRAVDKADQMRIDKLPRVPVETLPDLQLGPVAQRLRALLGMQAEMSVLIGADAPDNAFAEPPKNGQIGKIFFGEPLIAKYQKQLPDWWRLALAGVLAHEFGHLWQMQNAPALLARQTPSKVGELHADYLAGFFLSAYKREENIQISVFAKELYALGDLAFNHPQHHGTPEERQAAMIEGYKFGVQPAERPTFAQAAAAAGVLAKAWALD